MHYFNGFSFKGDDVFFSKYIDKKAYTVSGFSYGAIKAFKYALTCRDRIDKLQLFSPAFFQNKSENFRQTQLMQYQTNKKLYLKYFLRNCFKPHNVKEITQVDATKDELYEILYYKWEPEQLNKLKEKNIDIEVYVGQKDNIIDAKEVKDFFLTYATVYFIKNANHLLQLD